MKNQLVVSAMSGGAAEHVLRSLSHYPMRDFFKVDDSNIKRQFGLWIWNGNKCCHESEGIISRENNPHPVTRDIKCVIGTIEGLYLRDVDRLPDGKCFSMTHFKADPGLYTIPISTRILREGDSKSQMVNIRRIVYELASFIVQHPTEAALLARKMRTPKAPNRGRHRRERSEKTHYAFG